MKTEIKGSASNIYKLSLKESAICQKLNGTFLFQRSQHLNIYNFQKTLSRLKTFYYYSLLLKLNQVFCLKGEFINFPFIKGHGDWPQREVLKELGLGPVGAT